MITIQNKKIRDLTFPDDCLLERDEGKSIISNNSLVGRFASRLADSLSFRFKVDATNKELALLSEHEKLEFITHVQTNAISNSGLYGAILGPNPKARQQYVCIGGMIHNISKLNNGSYSDAFYVTLVNILHRMIQLIPGAPKNKETRLGINYAQSANKHLEKIFTFDGVSNFPDSNAVPVLASSFLESIKYCGCPLYVFLSSLMTCVRGEDLLIKLDFNPNKKKLTLREKSMLCSFHDTVNESYDNIGPVYLHIVSQKKEKRIGFRFLYVNKAGKLFKSGFISLSTEKTTLQFDLLKDLVSPVTEERVDHIDYITTSELLCSVLLDNGDIWRADAEYRVKTRVRGSLGTTSGITSNSSRFMNLPRWGVLSVGIEHNFSNVNDVVATSVIPTGSVISIEGEDGNLILGYFFVIKDKSLYKAVIAGEEIKKEEAKISGFQLLATGKTLQSVEKKLRILTDKEKLVVVVNQPYLVDYPGTIDLPLSSAEYLDSLLEVTKNQDDKGVQNPGDKMMFLRKINAFKRIVGFSMSNTEQTLLDLNKKKTNTETAYLPALPPLSSVDEFLKYGISVGGGDSFFDIMYTSGHFPYLYKYIVIRKAGEENYELNNFVDNPHRATIERRIRIDNYSSILIFSEKKFTKVPATFVPQRLNQPITQKIINADRIEGAPRDTIKLIEKGETTSTTMTMIGPITNEEKIEWI